MPCRSPRSAVRSSSVRELLGPSPVWHGPVPSAPNTPRPTVGLTGPPHLVGGVSSWQRSPCSCCDRAFWAILTRQIVSRGIVRGALLGIGLCFAYHWYANDIGVDLGVRHGDNRRLRSPDRLDLTTTPTDNSSSRCGVPPDLQQRRFRTPLPPTSRRPGSVLLLALTRASIWVRSSRSC